MPVSWVGYSCIAPDSFVVPSITSDGLSVKRLVIEQISAISYTNGAVNQLQASLATVVSENRVNSTFVPGIFLPHTPISPGSTPLASSLQVREFADPGTSVTLGMAGSYDGTGPGAQCNASVIGYFLTH